MNDPNDLWKLSLADPDPDFQVIDYEEDLHLVVAKGSVVAKCSEKRHACSIAEILNALPDILRSLEHLTYVAERAEAYRAKEIDNAHAKERANVHAPGTIEWAEQAFKDLVVARVNLDLSLQKYVTKKAGGQ